MSSQSKFLFWCSMLLDIRESREELIEKRTERDASATYAKPRLHGQVEGAFTAQMPWRRRKQEYTSGFVRIIYLTAAGSGKCQREQE